MKKKVKEAFKNVFQSIGFYGFSAVGVFTMILTPWMLRVVRLEAVGWPQMNLPLVVVSLFLAFVGFFILEKSGMPEEYGNEADYRRAAMYFFMGTTMISWLEKLAGV